MRRTQVLIVGAGPSGLLLALLLRREGIDCVVVERQERAHVEGRLRAGLLEPQTVDLIREAGVGSRMMAEGIEHGGFWLSFADRVHRIDLAGLAGHTVRVYGQSELQKDLGDAMGDDVVWSAGDVVIESMTTAVRVSFSVAGQRQVVEADFLAGCDGFHGVCRASVPAGFCREFHQALPATWLGVLAETVPVREELVYAHHGRGFALCSMRSVQRSRLYLECPADARVDDWSDGRFWDELRARLPAELAASVIPGQVIEKSVIGLRSFVVEPMRYGQLFLVGDAAHVVPPTGAKGLNLAAGDVRLLWHALTDHYRSGDSAGLDGYSRRALRRVWKATRFSWWMTRLLHRLGGNDADVRMQIAELETIADSRAASTVVAESYVGLF